MCELKYMIDIKKLDEGVSTYIAEDVIRKAVIESNPLKGVLKASIVDNRLNELDLGTIYLSDILLALSKTGYGNALLGVMIHKDGEFGILDFLWNCNKNSLAEQSDDCKVSIANLLI